jgi:hypothetical protein
VYEVAVSAKLTEGPFRALGVSAAVDIGAAVDKGAAVEVVDPEMIFGGE